MVEKARKSAQRAAVIRTLMTQADDPDRVKAALVDAANMALNIWVLFLSFGTYLVVTVGSVTHRQLFLDAPIHLPLLNVDLPMVEFFVVAPVLFLIFHIYLLLHLKLMADKVRLYSDLVGELGLEKITENRIRLQLPNFVFVQFLAGPHERWKNLTDWLLIVIAWLTVVIGPLILLLLTQLQLLPYHLAWMTWTQRAIIVLDIGVLWWFWPDIMPKIRVSRGRLLARRIVAAISSIVLIGFSVAIATFPGEIVYENWIARKIQIPEAFVSKGRTVLIPFHIVEQFKKQLLSNGQVPPQLKTVNLTKYLFEGSIDSIKNKPTSWFSNRLVLLDQELVDTDALYKIIDRQEKEGKQAWESGRTKILRGRDLRGALLNLVDLRRIDLSGAQLQDASLWGAQLQGALLYGAHLQGASLYEAHLQGASLENAQLQEASLDNAHLQGALLRLAQLQGASLDGAQLQRAALNGTQLQGASLNNAQLQGALLVGTELQGASLNQAQLQGAEFTRTQLEYSDLRGSLVWRSSRREIVLTGADLAGLSPDPASPGKDIEIFPPVYGVDNETTREVIRQGLGILQPNNPDWPSKRDEENAKFWSQQMAGATQKSHQELQDALASGLIRLGCADEGAPYVARGLIWHGRVAATGSYAEEIEQKLLTPKTCPGAAGLSDRDKYKLRAIVKKNKSSAPR